MAPYDSIPQPPPPRPKPPPTSAVVWLFALMGLGALLVIAAGIAFAVYRGFESAREAAPVSSPSVAAGSASSGARTKLPAMERRIPRHALTVLDGCSEDDVRLIAGGIDDAINVGAPLYNAGNFAGCFHMYEGAAADIERKLAASCSGPQRALEAGRVRAASLEGSSAQAWAMRDAFDGLIDLITRHEKGR